MVDALIGMSGTVSETQASMRQLMGMSRDMNKATALLSTSTGEFVSEVNTFIERLRRVDEACERKSQLVQVGA